MEPNALKKANRTRIIGLDFGLARIGIAISDERKVIASPFMVLKCEKRSEQTIAMLMKELSKHQETYRYEIEEIVIGNPLLLSGKSGLLADEVHHFVDKLRQMTSAPVILWDERLSTVQAERSLRESNMTRKKRTQFVDTVSAVIILQNYLDFKKLQEESPLRP